MLVGNDIGVQQEFHRPLSFTGPIVRSDSNRLCVGRERRASDFILDKPAVIARRTVSDWLKPAAWAVVLTSACKSSSRLKG